MNYIFTMTLSGSCMFGLYGLLRLCAKDSLKEGWYYNLLKVVALYFVIPLPWLKEGYSWLAEHLKPLAGGSLSINYSHQDWMLLQGENGWKLNDAMRVQVLILGIWICGVVIVGLVLLTYYLRYKRRVQSLYEEAENTVSQPWIDWLLRQMNVRVPIRFLECGKDTAPMTVGFLKPMVFYHSQEQTEETEMILKHELVHIKRKDMAWHFLAMVLVLMHWYNPLAWWYRRELENVCESSCDGWVLQGQMKRVRAVYVNLIFKYTTNQKGEIFGVPLSRGGKEVERRMMKIMTQPKKLPKAVSVGLAVALVVLNSITVLAYEDVKLYHADMKIEDIPTNADMAFTPEGEELVWGIPDYVANYVRVYDNQFVDTNGDVFEVQEDVETYFYCEHELVEGIQELHVEDGEGGCSVYFYNAKRCQLCGYLTDIVLVTEVKSVVCQH